MAKRIKGVSARVTAQGKSQIRAQAKRAHESISKLVRAKLRVR